MSRTRYCNNINTFAALSMTISTIVFAITGVLGGGGEGGGGGDPAAVPPKKEKTLKKW